jgi:hypothetical protein
MAVHVFPVESLPENHKDLSLKEAYSKVKEYLRERYQLGETTDEHMHCANMAALSNAIKKFVDWSKQHPPDDPKLLWMRLHGEPPTMDEHVGTRGRSSEDEIFDWWKVFSGVCGKFPRNVVVIMDVCWGASPAAPQMLTKGTGNPALLFGSVRAAYPFELETAIGLVVGALTRGVVPTVTEAKGMVRALNTAFPSDPKNNKPFYRVCSWTKRSTRPNCYPAPRSTRLTRVCP